MQSITCLTYLDKKYLHAIQEFISKFLYIVEEQHLHFVRIWAVVCLLCSWEGTVHVVCDGLVLVHKDLLIQHILTDDEGCLPNNALSNKPWKGVRFQAKKNLGKSVVTCDSKQTIDGCTFHLTIATIFSFGNMPYIATTASQLSLFKAFVEQGCG